MNDNLDDHELRRRVAMVIKRQHLLKINADIALITKRKAWPDVRSRLQEIITGVDSSSSVVDQKGALFAASFVDAPPDPGARHLLLDEMKSLRHGGLVRGVVREVAAELREGSK